MTLVHMGMLAGLALLLLPAMTALLTRLPLRGSNRTGSRNGGNATGRQPHNRWEV